MTTPITCPHCSSSDTTFKAKAQLWECNECEKRFEDPATQKVAPQTIFLSYAHKSEKEEDYDISEDLVWLIKEELAKDGHEVWIDHEGIRGGTQWRERITDAITSHKHFLAFLSKRSVRHEPNVCLNEVAIAIKHNRIIQTILTEPENQVSAPLTLSSIQWHKFSDWKDIKEGKKTGPKGEDWDAWFGSLMSGIRQNLADITYQKAVGELSELKEIFKPTSFDAAIINSVEGFFGRQWLFDATNEWFKTDNRLFWLKGTPGIGKSSFAAKLVHSGNSSIVGFFKCDFQGLKSAEESASECIRTLAYQLASRLPDYRIKLLRGQQVDAETVQKKTADDLFTYLITEPLNRSEKIAEAGRLALVIDALDEAGRLVNGKMANPLADLLYKHADQLPPWLGVIVTSRPEAYLQQQLGAKFSPLIMEGGTQNNLEDIKDYLETKLDSGITGEQREKTIAAIIDKSGGTFLYVKRVEQEYDLSKPEILPNGLDDLFYKDFERYFPDPKAYEDKTEKFLRLLVAAPGPLPKQMAQELLQWQARDITRYVTQPMASLLTETEEGLQFFHKSIKDLLQDGSRSGIYQVNDTGAKELGEFLWNEFEKGQPKEEVKEGEEKETAEVTETKDKPKRNPSTWEKQVIKWLAPLMPNLEQWQERGALDAFADYLHKGLKYQDELIIRRQHLKLTEDEFGEGGEEAVLCLSNLGGLLYMNSRLEEADILLGRAFELMNKNINFDYLLLSSTLNNYGYLCCDLGKYEKAESLFSRALDIREREFGSNSSHTIQSVAALSYLMNAQCRYQESEALSRKVFEFRKKSADTEPSAFALSACDLAISLSKLGREQEAESLHRTALEIRCKLLGFNHPETAQSMDGLGVTLIRLGQNDEAESLFRRAIDAYEEIFGGNENHDEIASASNNLGQLLSNLERYDEAEYFLKRAQKICESLYGVESPWTAVASNNLGLLFTRRGADDEAELQYRKALDIYKTKLGYQSYEVADMLDTLADQLWSMDRLEEGRNLYLQSFDIIQKIENAPPDALASGCRKFGSQLRESGFYDEADVYLTRALQIKEDAYGFNSDMTTMELSAIGKLRLMQKRYEESEIFLLRCLDVLTNMNSLDRAQLKRAKERLTQLYELWGRPEEAANYQN